MTIYIDDMTITRVITKTKYWDSKKKKSIPYKKPVITREFIGKVDPVDLEGFLKEVFFNCDKEYQAGWNSDWNVQIEIKANFNKEIF